VRSSRLDEVTTSERPPAGGHPAWLVELFQANVSAAFNVAYRLVWNRADAQDVVQSSFIKATRSISQLRDASKARGWLLSITYREALMVLRLRRDLPTDPFALPERVGQQPTPEDQFLQHELAEEIRTAIDHLPEVLRTAFVLRDVEELPMSEVAEVLDIGASAAKMRVARARELLRISLTGRI
jgi:RNA polymerase sigma-70 factor (ECF subfamily)